MGWRFQRRKKIGPGVTLNLSKRGVGVSVGPQGAKVSTGPRGTELHLGIPGSGLSHRSKIGGGVLLPNGSSGVPGVVLLVMIPYILMFLVVFHRMIYVLVLTPIGHALASLYFPAPEDAILNIPLLLVVTALCLLLGRWAEGMKEWGHLSRSEYRQLVNIYIEEHPEQKLSFKQARAQMKRDDEEDLAKALAEYDEQYGN